MTTPSESSTPSSSSSGSAPSDNSSGITSGVTAGGFAAAGGGIPAVPDGAPGTPGAADPGAAGASGAGSSGAGSSGAGSSGAGSSGGGARAATGGPGSPGAIPPGPAGVPSLPAQTTAGGAPSVVIGTYPDYAMAQQAVDTLSDNKFPVERTAIIGTDLRLVENVLGRLTTGRAALAGAASGAWFGLFVGLLFGLFSDEGWVGVILVCLLIGAAWGAIFGAIAHAATGGRRDFASRSSIQAGQYAVTADPEVADQARSLLVQLNWRASGAQ